jgi:hypothetical protein
LFLIKEKGIKVRNIKKQNYENELREARENNLNNEEIGNENKVINLNDLNEINMNSQVQTENQTFQKKQKKFVRPDAMEIDGETNNNNKKENGKTYRKIQKKKRKSKSYYLANYV